MNPYSCILQAINEEGVKVYQYHLTYRSMSSFFPEWYGVVHGADIQVRQTMAQKG